MSTVSAAPRTSAMAPMMITPKGEKPMNTTRRLIMRPRRWSGASCCMATVIIVMNITCAPPRPKIATRETGNRFDWEKTMSINVLTAAIDISSSPL